jgi:uncharacterized protein
MTITLYDLSVPTYLQTTRALSGVLKRAARHCAETGVDPDDFVLARLYEDMAPLSFQIEALWHHAVWSVEALKTGEFNPPPLVWPVHFSELQTIIGKAEAALTAFTPDEVNGRSGQDLDIEIFQPVDEDNASTSSWAAQTLAFTPETFLLSYSLPNFYFHAVTAYDILRSRGVPIGKGDYQGRLRLRSA